MSGSWRPLPDPDGPQPRPVAESLEAVARTIGGAGGPSLVSLLTRWPDVVGAQLAAHCRPLSLRRGVLTIAADSPAWASQIGWLEADLRTRIGEAVGPGAVTRVAVRVVPP